MTIDVDRLKRAVHLVVEALDERTFRVSGGAEPHIVEGDRCNCTDQSVRGGRCKHVLAVMLHTGDRETLVALREVVPLPGRSRKHHPAVAPPPTPHEKIVVEQPLKPIPEAGALKLWRLEVERGIRTMYFADDLRDAAIHEANARDEIRDGMIAAANDSRRTAAAILVRRFAKAAVA